MKHVIQQAIQTLKQGGIVIFPTDTAFGIGCRIDDKNAVDRLFRIRKRPVTQATPVLVVSIAMALPYLDSPSDIVRHFMKTYWPGALTIITPCHKDLIYSPIRGGGETVGIRMPDHSDILHVIHEVGVPVLGPSANIHGENTPFRFEDLDPALSLLVDFVMPGVCKEKRASTVVDCSVDPYIVIRQGAVKIGRPDVILKIDSSHIKQTVVSIITDKAVFEKKIVSQFHTSQQVLPMIESLLSEHNLTLTDVASIEVASGPGSFTGLRVGVAIANALGLLLDIPVNGKKTPVVSLQYGESDRWNG